MLEFAQSIFLGTNVDRDSLNKLIPALQTSLTLLAIPSPSGRGLETVLRRGVGSGFRGRHMLEAFASTIVVLK